MSANIQVGIFEDQTLRGLNSEIEIAIPEINKEVVRRWNEEIWQGSHAVFEELLDPHCVFHGLGGVMELQQTVRRIRRAFGDLQLTIHDLIAAEDKVITRWALTGLHVGMLWGVKPSGKSIDYTGITINRLENGRIVEEWYESDIYGLMEQLRSFY